MMDELRKREARSGRCNLKSGSRTTQERNLRGVQP
tara:strand:- start:314 stop:418 length:105 start_codon:yes stop_codon:yes gene_type:complete